MELINVLFIDDHDISTEIQRLRKALSKRQIHLQETMVRVSDSQFKSTNPKDNTINIDEVKLKTYFKDQLFNQKFDVIACDFDFADAKYNGYQLLAWLINTANQAPKAKIRHAKFVFYTSNTGSFSEIASKDVMTLLRLKIEKLINRPHITEQLTKLICEMKDEVNLLNEFKGILETHATKKFKSTYPKFKDKNLGEIFTEIEEETHHGKRYQKALLEQAISHMIELQDD